MDLGPLRDRLLALHIDDMQTITRIIHSVRELESGLAALARLGHPFHLETGHCPVPRTEWPSIWFHAQAAPHGRSFTNEYDLREQGPNWFPTALEAQLWDGMQTQFTGRGGVKRTGVLVALALEDDSAQVAAQTAETARLVAEFKARNKGNDATE